jgi:hypothetical protein
MWWRDSSSGPKSAPFLPMPRLTLIASILLFGAGLAAADAPPPRKLKQLKSISAVVLPDGTTSYLPNGDFARGLADWQIHGQTKTVLSLSASDLPAGVTGEALHYRKSDAASGIDFHLNHLIRVPSPGAYVLSYWCKTTPPLVPMVVVRSNWNRADLKLAKMFEIKNDGAWRHYENTFAIDPSWPTTFVIQVIPGSKGINLEQSALGIAFNGETWFADFRCERRD